MVAHLLLLFGEDGAGLVVRMGVHGGIWHGPYLRQVLRPLKNKALLHKGNNV